MLSVRVGWTAISEWLKSPAALTLVARLPKTLALCASLVELRRAWQRSGCRVDAIWGDAQAI